MAPERHAISCLRGWAGWACIEGRSVSFVGLLIAALGMGGICSRGEPALTNVAQLRLAAAQAPPTGYRICLEGNVWWASPTAGRFVFQDASGAVELECYCAGDPVQSGQRVRVAGHGTVTRRGASLRLGAKGPVVDNDGIHPMVEKSGAVYLRAGRQPICIEWFNALEAASLNVEYEGPGLPRQRIPDQVLFRNQAPPGRSSSEPANGLDWRCFEGVWEVLPDPRVLSPAKTGLAANFHAAVVTRAENVALQFSGYLQVPREGLYTFHLASDDGSRLSVGEPTLRLQGMGAGAWPVPRRLAIGQLLDDDQEGEWAVVEGRVSAARQDAGGLILELSAGPARMRVDVADASGWPLVDSMHRRIRAVGFCQRVITADGQQVAGVLLTPSVKELERIDDGNFGLSAEVDRSTLPLLTTADAVHRLKREEAQRGYEARIRGVVTCVLPKHQAVTIQDRTRGLYVVDASTNRAGPPRIGEFLEVEGVTDPGLFAPCLQARRVHSLGMGQLPEPVRPNWDQLMNGSLDAQYVELQGILTGVQAGNVTLLARGGVIRIELRVTGLASQDLRRLENALVRVRGCLFASWDYRTHQVKPGEVRIYDAELVVDQAAPGDLFSSPSKNPAELLLFDPHAGAFQRLKVAGQIVQVRGVEHFMMDGRQGVRVLAKEPLGLQPGDRVEAVGFPDLLGAASPVLREAVLRKVGHAPLPEAPRLASDNLLRAEHDATRVKIEGVLVGRRGTGTEQVLEMQNGVRTFAARLPRLPGLPLWGGAVGSLPVGSRLELTGVYDGLGGNRAAGQPITSFELLLQGPADITELARPSWWTLQRLLVIVGALGIVLAATGLWITQLRRQVGERTAELSAQILQRQRAEHQRALELERARIAQDLHDELGSGVTEISMLAARANSAAVSDERRSRYLEQAGDKAREMVMALDEIVWATNPRHDSLASLVSYFSLYADRFLSLANIAWRLEGPAQLADYTVDSRHRHQLFLAFKEALTNVVRHSEATEVRVHIQLEAGEVRLTIADNGRGLPAHACTEGMDGVANMRSRLEKLGGRFEVTSAPGRGTQLCLCVPAGAVAPARRDSATPEA